MKLSICKLNPSSADFYKIEQPLQIAVRLTHFFETVAEGKKDCFNNQVCYVSNNVFLRIFLLTA